MRCVKILGLAAVLLTVGIAPSRATNLVTDPGFESCPPSPIATPPGWNASGPLFCSSSSSHSGSYAVGFFSASTTFLSQTIATTPGHTYDFSFWILGGGTSGTIDTFDASFGTHQVLHQVAVLPNYTLEDFQLSATSASTTISFAGGTTVDGGPAWFLDDVAVTDLTLPQTTQEPASLVILGAGLAALGLARRRKS